jgi:hypothetical protein
MIHFFSLLFLLLLLGVHVCGKSSEIDALPLSMFRDGPFFYAGAALFGLLLAVGACLMWLMVRLERYGECLILATASVLLLVVALTPSLDEDHLICSLVLMSLLFFYYALLIYYWKPLILNFHLAMPVILVLVTQLHSYGAWQKTFIVYFLLLMNVHYFVLRLMGRPPVKICYQYPPRSTAQRQSTLFTLSSEEKWPRHYRNRY